MPEQAPAEPALPAGTQAVDQQVDDLNSLLERLNEASQERALSSPGDVHEHRLAEVRLGVASSLFTALRCKHRPTAAHSLRVALTCSSWSRSLKLSSEERDQIELAALMHDIGKIAVPDAVLLKPGTLLPEELELMDRHRPAGLDILRSCCSSSAILEIVRQLPAWYDGSRTDYELVGRDIPLGARMLSIVDAYDSMTTDQVWRRAMSRDRALSELFSYAGAQFDPDLAALFAELHQANQPQDQVAARWLADLQPQHANSLWRWSPSAIGKEENPNDLFQQKLLDNMHDAVVFVDRDNRIMLWNRGAERLTGIAGSAACEQIWSPKLIGLRDDNGLVIADRDCPMTYTMHACVQSLRRYMIQGRGVRPVEVDLHAVPIVAADGKVFGAALLLHDASPEASLEKRCQSLHERATKDPLTQVANRAEFDRTHKMFVAAHLERRLPCSLIICDIDHFKQINDTFGHPAGDDALKNFAQMLKSACHPGDLVARYGGEEFVLLCADCNTATAARRAEQIRKDISALPQGMLDGNRMTVSFGVTEVQPGDTAATMLRRADRALLEAKQRGRNTVVQLGGGVETDEVQPQRRSWFARQTTPELVLEKWLVTSVPRKMAMEKLRGFVVDHFAEITSIQGDKVLLKVDATRSGARRNSDRPVPMMVELTFFEELAENSARSSNNAARVCRTKVHVAIRPRRDRDRRRQNLTESARQLAVSIKSYLMASEEDPQQPGDSSRAAPGVLPWLRKRGT